MSENFYVFDRTGDFSRARSVASHPGTASGASAQVLEFGQTLDRPDQDAADWMEHILNDYQCLVVLIGAKTTEDPWVREAIVTARTQSIPVIGVTINRIADERGEQGAAPSDPFEDLGLSPRALSQIEVYEPPFVLSVFARAHVAYGIADWTELAVRENDRRLGSRGGRRESFGQSRRVDLHARAS